MISVTTPVLTVGSPAAEAVAGTPTSANAVRPISRLECRDMVSMVHEEPVGTSQVALQGRPAGPRLDFSAPMAQTKRKRRSKHRGNAAGTSRRVAARGAARRRPTPRPRRARTASAAADVARRDQPGRDRHGVLLRGDPRHLQGAHREHDRSRRRGLLMYIPLGFYTDPDLPPPPVQARRGAKPDGRPDAHRRPGAGELLPGPARRRRPRGHRRPGGGGRPPARRHRRARASRSRRSC